MYHGSHGGMPQLLPGALHEEAKAVPKTMERSPGHYEEWVAACKGGQRPVSNFDYCRPDDRNGPAGRAGAASARDAAGMGQREPEGEERAGAEPVRAHRVPQGLDALTRAKTSTKEGARFRRAGKLLKGMVGLEGIELPTCDLGTNSCFVSPPASLTVVRISGFRI